MSFLFIFLSTSTSAQTLASGIPASFTSTSTSLDAKLTSTATVLSKLLAGIFKTAIKLPGDLYSFAGASQAATVALCFGNQVCWRVCPYLKFGRSLFYVIIVPPRNADALRISSSCAGQWFRCRVPTAGRFAGSVVSFRCTAIHSAHAC